MQPSLITTILNILFFAIIAIGFLFGLKGVKKAGYSLLMFVASFVVILFVMTPISRLILKIKINGSTLQNTISTAISDLMVEELAENDIIKSLINNIPLMIINIAVFFVLMFIISLLFKLIGAIILKIVNRKNTKDKKVVEECEIVNGAPKMTKRTVKQKKYRLLGGLVGAVQGFLFACLTFLPIMGLSSTFSDLAGFNTVQAQQQNSQEVTSDNQLKYIEDLLQENLPNEVKEYVQAIDNSILAKIGKVGNISEATLNIVSTCEINNQKISLGHEIRTLAGVYNDFIDFFNEASIRLNTNKADVIFNDIAQNPNLYNFTQIEEIINNLFNSNLIKAVGNDALKIGVELASNSNKNQELNPIYEHLQVAINNYAQNDYNLKTDILALVKVFQICAENKLLQEFNTQNQKINLDNIANILFNKASSEKDENEVLNLICTEITKSNLLQTCLVEGINLGTSYLADAINSIIIKDDPNSNLNFSKIVYKDENKLQNTELSNIIVKAYDIYQKVKDIDFKTIEQNYNKIYEYKPTELIKTASSELKYIVNLSVLQGSSIYQEICTAMTKTKYNDFISFDALKDINSAKTQLDTIADVLVIIKDSDILTKIQDTDDLPTTLITELAKETNNKTLLEQVLEPLLNCNVTKNTLVYGLDYLRDTLQSTFDNMIKDPIVISDFNTTNLYTTEGKAELLNILSNALLYAKDIDLKAFTEGDLTKQLLKTDLHQLGLTLDLIKNSILFSQTTINDDSTYIDLINILSQTEFNEYLYFEATKAESYSWEQEMTALDTLIDNLNTIKVGDVAFFDYILEDGHFDGILDAINKDNAQNFLNLFKIDLIKPVALFTVNSINTAIKDFVGEDVLGANIVPFDINVDLKTQAESITNVIASASAINLNETNMEKINKDDLNDLLLKLEINANQNGVFKESYNALLLKTIDIINDKVKSFVGESVGCKITMLEGVTDVISLSQQIRNVLTMAIDTVESLNNITEFKNINTNQLFLFILSLNNSAFKESYNAMLVYIVNEVNTQIANYVGSTFNAGITGYDGNVDMSLSYNLIKELVESAVDAYGAIDEDQELKDIDSAKLTRLLNALSYLSYTQVSYNALNNKLAATVIEGINSLTGKQPATLNELKDLKAQASDIKNILDTLLTVLPSVEKTGVKLKDMEEQTKPKVVNLLNAFQNNANTFKENSVFNDSYQALIGLIEEKNGLEQGFINNNIKDSQGIINWEEFILPQA